MKEMGGWILSPCFAFLFNQTGTFPKPWRTVQHKQQVTNRLKVYDIALLCTWVHGCPQCVGAAASNGSTDYSKRYSGSERDSCWKKCSESIFKTLVLNEQTWPIYLKGHWLSDSGKGESADYLVRLLEYWKEKSSTCGGTILIISS